MADASVSIIDFRGDQLIAMQMSSGVYVALRPICERLGLGWSSQLKRLNRDPILAEGVVMMATAFTGLGQEMVCLRLDLVHGWLFSIDADRVRDDRRDVVLAYKRECYTTLFQHFFPQAEHDPAGRSAFHDPVTESWREKRALVAEARLVWGERIACALWIRLGLPTVAEMMRGPPQGELPIE